MSKQVVNQIPFPTNAQFSEVLFFLTQRKAASRCQRAQINFRSFCLAIVGATRQCGPHATLCVTTSCATSRCFKVSYGIHGSYPPPLASDDTPQLSPNPAESVNHDPFSRKRCLWWESYLRCEEWCCYTVIHGAQHCFLCHDSAGGDVSCRWWVCCKIRVHFEEENIF